MQGVMLGSFRTVSTVLTFLMVGTLATAESVAVTVELVPAAMDSSQVLEEVDLRKGTFQVWLESNEDFPSTESLVPTIIEGNRLRFSVPAGELSSRPRRVRVWLESGPMVPLAGELRFGVTDKGLGTENGPLRMLLHSAENVVQRFRLVDADGRPVVDQPLGVHRLDGDERQQIVSRTTDKTGHITARLRSSHDHVITPSLGGRLDPFAHSWTVAQADIDGDEVIDLRADDPLIKGRIVDFETGELIVGADEPIDLVSIRDGVTYVDPVEVRDGRFAVHHDLEQGAYRIEIDHHYPEYRVVGGGELAVTGEPVNHELRLAIRQPFSFEVIALAGGELLAQARIALVRGDRVYARGTGSLAHKAVVSGEYTLQVEANGFVPESRKVNVDGPVEMTVSMRPLVALRVMLEDVDPVEMGAEVRVLQLVDGPEAEPDEHAGRPLEAGGFRVDGLAPGPALLVVDVPGRARLLRVLHVEDDDRIVVRPETGVALSGRVEWHDMPDEPLFLLLDPNVGFPASVAGIPASGKVSARVLPGEYLAFASDGRIAYPLGALRIDGDRPRFDRRLDVEAKAKGVPVKELLDWSCR